VLVPAVTVAARAPRTGTLLWQASLDAAGSDLEGQTSSPDAAASRIRTTPGAIEIAVLARSGSGGAMFRRSLPRLAIVEIDYRAKTGSDVRLTWRVGSAGERKTYQVELDTIAESMRFARFDPAAPSGPASTYLTPPIPVPGLQSGLMITLGIDAQENAYVLYLDGKKVFGHDRRRSTERSAAEARLQPRRTRRHDHHLGRSWLRAAGRRGRAAARPRDLRGAP
jgi:hypothetical protein